MVACDFFTVDTIGLARACAFVLFLIELASRQILQFWPGTCAGASEATGVRPKLLLRDRDSKFSFGFDAVLADEGIATLRTSYRTPQANGHAERWDGSVRRECLREMGQNEDAVDAENQGRLNERIPPARRLKPASSISYVTGKTLTAKKTKSARIRLSRRQQSIRIGPV